MLQKKDTREEILVVALKLFLKRGITNVSVSNIITTAGYTQAALYYYFESKDQLIDEMMYKYYFGFMSDTLTSIEQEDLNWKEIIERFFQLGIIETEHINKVVAPTKITSKEMGSLLREYLDYKKMRHESFNRFSAKKYKMIYNTIKNGQEHQEIRSDLDAYLITNMILGMHEGNKLMGEYMDFFNYYAYDGVTSHYVEMLIQYLSKENENTGR